MAMYYETRGSGPTVVFIHPAIADCRIWDPQWTSFASRYRLVRMDLAGFGRTPIESMPLTHARDVASLLDELSIAGAAVVGASLGGRVALEVAVARPDLVAALALIGSGLPGIEWSQPVRDYGEAEEEAVARGDLDAATEINLRTWVDGPRRSPADVDPVVRSSIGTMQRRALELQTPFWDNYDEELLTPDIAERLGEVRVPALVVVGDEDVHDIHVIAKRLESEIPDARRVTIPDAAHAPNLEQPDAFDSIVLDFLADCDL